MTAGRLCVLFALQIGCGRVSFESVCGLEPLAISPAAARANLNSQLLFDARGGCPPYLFTQSGSGEIDPDGLYVTGANVGASEIVVTDSLGDTATTSLEIGGTTLWYVGGSVNDVPKDEVWRSEDGRSWTMVGRLPAETRGAVTLVYNDQIWVIGGTGALQSDAVWVSSDGLSWSLAGRLPAPSSYPSATVFERQLWMIGGNGVPGQVLTSPDGAVWTRVGDIPILSHGGSAIVFDERLWYLGGHDVDGLFFDEVRSTSDGATWTTEGLLPSERELMGAWVANGKLVVAGGTGNSVLDEVTTSSDGVTWAVEGVLPARRFYGGFAELGAVRWAVGGTDGGAVWSSTSGLSWVVETTNFPLPRADGGLVVFSPP